MSDNEGVEDALLIAVERTRNKLRRAAMMAQQGLAQDSDGSGQGAGDGINQFSAERRTR